MAIHFDTLAEAFADQARKYDARPFLKDKNGGAWRDHSWRDLDDAASRLRTGLLALGLGRGDRIAILSENCPNWVVVDQAALGMGAAVVPLYTTSGIEETRHVLNNSGSRIVAANGEAAIRKIVALKPDLSKLDAVVAMHPGASDESAGGLAIRSLASVSAPDSAPVVKGSRDDLATIIYTSGTTGASKGVMLSHGNILANCDSSQQALDLGESDLTLSFLPIAHSFERTAGYYTVMIAGGMIAYAEGLTQIAQNLLEVNPTVVLTVPRLLEVIYTRVSRMVEAAPATRRALFHLASATGRRAAEYRFARRPRPAHIVLAMALFRRVVFKRIRSLFGTRIRYLISGGAPLPLEVFRFLAAAEVPIVEGYGLTEAAPVVAVNLHGHTRIGTVGRPLANIAVRTAADGELLVRGANVMRGYWGLEAETREAVDVHGWLHTGDIARIDRDGYIAITDRKKEIIVLSGGKNVSPAKLETRLAADPAIAQACVVGDRRKHLGALIVPDFEFVAAEPALKAAAAKGLEQAVGDPAMRKFYQSRIREFNRTLSDAETISTFALLSKPFSQDNGELTPTLKLRRRVVQDHYRREIDSMYGAT